MDPDVAVLPDVASSHVLILAHRLDLSRHLLHLVLLAPLDRGHAVLSGDPARAKLGDQDRLVGIELCHAPQIVRKVGPLDLGHVPADILVQADRIGQVQVLVVPVTVRDISDQACLVQIACQAKQLGHGGGQVHLSLHADLGLALVVHAPCIDARMVELLVDHLAQHVLELALGRLGGDLCRAVLPARQLGEKEQSCLVAQVEESRVVGIVRAAHGVAVQVLDDLDVALHQLVRLGKAPVGMVLVAVHAADPDLFAVEQDVAALGPDLAQPKAFLVQVGAQLHDRRIQVRRVGAPELWIGDAQCKLLFLRCVRSQRHGPGPPLPAYADRKGHRHRRGAAVAHPHAHIHLPVDRAADVDAVDEHRVHLLADHRAGDAAIGEPVHRILGQRGLAVAVVDAYDQLVLVALDRGDKAERGKAALVFAEVLAVQPHARQVGHRAKGQLGRSFKVRLEHLAVPGHAVVVVQAELGVPAAGHGDRASARTGRSIARPFALLFRVCTKLPPPIQDDRGAVGCPVVASKHGRAPSCVVVPLAGQSDSVED